MEQQWRSRFDALVNRRTRDAAYASLPAYITDLSSPGAGMLALGNPWSTQLFDGPFYESPLPTTRPACSLVFVQSAEGNTGGADPSTLGGGETDKHLIYEGLSRVGADAVLAGAETARGASVFFSVWHPELVALRASLGLPRHPVQIIATRRGVDLNRQLVFNVPEVPVVLLTIPEAAERMQDDVHRRPWITLVVMPPPTRWRSAFTELLAMGIARISCVGGRTIATHLLDAGLVDDVYLTTSAQHGGEPGTPLCPHAWRGAVVVRKRGTGVEAGVVFEHVLPATPSK